MRVILAQVKHITLLFELTLKGQKHQLISYAMPRITNQRNRTKQKNCLVKDSFGNPHRKESQLVEFPLAFAIKAPSEDMRFHAAVAAYGQKLRGSEYLNNTSWQQIKQWAQKAKGEDPGLQSGIYSPDWTGEKIWTIHKTKMDNSVLPDIDIKRIRQTDRKNVK